MIVYLEGVVHRINEDSIVLLSYGVGYQVYLSRPTVEGLPEEGSPINLHIHAVIREDSHQLFGFTSLAEKALFLKLLQVSSIGPKLALTILSGLPATELAQAIHNEDLVRLTAISGIGKKTAERLIVDLKDKILELLGPRAAVSSPKPTPQFPEKAEEALSALMNLGYSRQEAQKALSNLSHDKDLSLEALVREGLKALS